MHLPERKSKKKSKKKTTRTWIRHEVIPGEMLQEIADRYGVSKKAIARWNRLDVNRPKLRVGQKLKIGAKRLPPERREVRYEVKRGDTWQKIADAHSVELKQLRRWNRKVGRRFKAGQILRLWQDDAGAIEKVPGEAPQRELPKMMNISDKAKSVGSPNRGRLANGIQLPENKELYTRVRPDNLWGASHTLRVLQLAIARWRRDSSYDGRLGIGAISRRKGGRFAPHRSHQSGRDVDIRLPLRSGKPGTLAKSMADVDWAATWKLVDALLKTGEIEYIFLSKSRQRRLYHAALQAGVDKKRLAKIMQYPKMAKRTRAIIRHSRGHDKHFHVRFRCGKNESQCKV